MKDDLVSLYAYDRWANRRVLDACRALSPEQYAAEPVPGWSSVRSTVVHVVAVYDIWLRRLTDESGAGLPTETELATVEQAERHLEQSYTRIDAMLQTLGPEQMSALVPLRRQGQTVFLPPWAVFRHLVNHATYHRGQVAAKLKRLGSEQPATDFSLWVFEQTPQPG